MRQSESNPARATGRPHGKHLHKTTGWRSRAMVCTARGMGLAFCNFRRRSLAFLLLLATAIVPSARAEDQKAGGEFDCLIQPKMVLKLGTPVPGLINEVLVDRGVIVKKGDVIATARVRRRGGGSGAGEGSGGERGHSTTRTVRSSSFKGARRSGQSSCARTIPFPLAAADEAETAARVAQQRAG